MMSNNHPFWAILTDALKGESDAPSGVRSQINLDRKYNKFFVVRATIPVRRWSGQQGAQAQLPEWQGLAPLRELGHRRR